MFLNSELVTQKVQIYCKGIMYSWCVFIFLQLFILIVCYFNAPFLHFCSVLNLLKQVVLSIMLGQIYCYADKILFLLLIFSDSVMNILILISEI